MAGATTLRAGLMGGGGGAGSLLNNPVFHFLHKHRGLVIPTGFIAMIMVLLVPLPTGVLDLLLVTNLAMATVVLVSVMFVTSPLDLSIFPSLLLGTTLFRLVLNVASTRLILTAGDRSTDAATAAFAAGNVIHAFSTFVTGGGTGAQQQMVVGIIIFIILIIIQFVVITKGATRISEVAARFTLDAMPGKQMAIDADLNAGIIKEDEAKRRRSEIAREAEFYGAMDGASKFVRGDAIAGILIVFINVIGGVAIGKLQYGWGLLECAKTFTQLTIGDGIVSQVPALIISLAAGLLVTRSSSKENLGEEFIQQLTGRAVSLAVVAAFLMMMSFTGLPLIPLWILATCLGSIAWVMTKREKAAVVEHAKRKKPPPAQPRKNLKKSKPFSPSTPWNSKLAINSSNSSTPPKAAISSNASASSAAKLPSSSASSFRPYASATTCNSIRTPTSSNSAATRSPPASSTPANISRWIPAQHPVASAESKPKNPPSACPPGGFRKANARRPR